MTDRRKTIAESSGTLSSKLDPKVRWVREKEIARGGMGRIDLVFDRTLQRRLAMKCILPEQWENAGDFMREARITGRIEHPHIVPVHELDTDPAGLPFFTMKLVKGKTLGDVMYDERPLHDQARLMDLLDVILKVCDALDYAHACGVVHRDLKPDNIMIGDFGEVYLMDWGVARIFDPGRFFDNKEAELPVDEIGFLEATDEGFSIGTPEYMSPEQAEALNDQLDERSDIWALGVILYELLTRRVPFHDSDVYALFDKIKAGKFVPPSEVPGQAWVPDRLEEIIGRALTVDLTKRYRTIREFKFDLQRFLRGNSDFPTTDYKAGDIIVRVGDVGHEAYVIASGRCSVWAETDTGPVLLNEMAPGDVFGEVAVFAEGTRAATVKADEATTCFVISKEHIDAEIESQKPWIAAFIKTLAARFSQNSQRLSGLLTPSDPLTLVRDVFMYACAFGEPHGMDRSVNTHKCLQWMRERHNVDPERARGILEQMPGVKFTSDQLYLSDIESMRKMLK